MIQDKITLQIGDVVRVKDPSLFLAAFALKIQDRDAIVQWVGPLPNGMMKNRAGVRFLKRNGRGKEFEEVMHISSVEKVTK